MNAAATAIQAVVRGHQDREWLNELWNESLFDVEYGIYQEVGHARTQEVHGHIWANMCFQYVKDGVMSYEEMYDKENQFGPEYSSDNSGDGPFGAILVVIILVLDKLNSQRGRIGQWRAKDRALKELAQEYPFTFVMTCTIIRHKIGRDYYLGACKQLGKQWRSNNAGDGPVERNFSHFEVMPWETEHPRTVNDVLIQEVRDNKAFGWGPKDDRYGGDYEKWFSDLKRFQAGEKQLGKSYRSNNAGDGPPSAKVIEEPPIPDVGDIVVEEDDMEILLFRFEILTEMIDLQIWTYGMRLHEHEYQGEPFDHHEHLGTTEIFARISRFNNALHNHFRTGGGDCWVDRESWMSTLNDLETIERADMFHDVHCQEHLQSMVTDFILFSVMDDHHFEPRSTDTCFQIPLF